MISSTRPYGGLSAADLATLFGTTPASSATSTAAPTSTGASISGASTSAKAIQAILAQVQVDKARIVPSDAGPVSSATVEAAYAAQVSARTSDGSVAASVAGTAMATYAVQPADPTASVTSEWAWQLSGNGWSVSESVTSVSSADAGSPDARTNIFKMAITRGNVSVGIQFSVQGLGELTVDPNGLLDFGHGDRSEVLQFGLLGADGGLWVPNINVFGLDTAQANQIGAAFRSVASALDIGALDCFGYSLDVEGGMVKQSGPAWSAPSP